MKKLNILIRGWDLHHSYGVVNCCQIVHFEKYFKDTVHIVFQEMPFFNPNWKKKPDVFPPDYEEILKNIEKYDDKKTYDFDLIYNITFPYIVEYDSKFKNIKKYVFYTSEYKTLSYTFFKDGFSNASIRYIINQDDTLHFVGPCKWSCEGLDDLIPEKSEQNHCVVLGVDSNVFKKDITSRQEIRTKYKIKDDEILIANIGSMSGNKNIHMLLASLYNITRTDKKWKLLLKGSGDLYRSTDLMKNTINLLKNQTKTNIDDFIKEHVIFIDNTLSCHVLNNLYNACDLYTAPYLMEGFGLTPLEALSAGLPVLVPETGSTQDYINDISSHCNTEKMIYKVKSTVIKANINTPEKYSYINDIKLEDIIDTMLSFKRNGPANSESIRQVYDYIGQNYSWKNSCQQLLNIFQK